MLRTIGLAQAVLAGALSGLLLLSGGAIAQDYPTKPITLIVPTPAGGSTIDTVTRIIADKLKVELGQPVIVENRAGGNGYVAAHYVSTSKPDGYVLLSFLDIYAVGSFTQKDFNINLAEDLQPVAYPIQIWSHIYTKKASPFKTFKDFIAYAKANPGKLNLGVAPLSSTFDAALLFSELGLDVVTVLYQGGGQATQALLSGTTDLLITGYTGTIKAQIDEGNIVPLAALGRERSDVTPDLPWITQFAPNFSGVGAGYGISGPKGMPADVVAKLNQAINKIMKDPSVVQRVGTGFGFAIVDNSKPEDWKAKVIETTEKYRRATKMLNYQPQ